MPNHCYNRVTFYSDDKEKEIKTGVPSGIATRYRLMKNFHMDLKLLLILRGLHLNQSVKLSEKSILTYLSSGITMNLAWSSLVIYRSNSMTTYIIKESCVLIRRYTVEADSKEEARSKHDQGLSTTDSYYDEDADGSHQVEEIVQE